MISSKTNTYKQNMKGWMVVACGVIFYMYQFMIRVSSNMMNNELLSNFALDAAGLGGITWKLITGRTQPCSSLLLLL